MINLRLHATIWSVCIALAGCDKEPPPSPEPTSNLALAEAFEVKTVAPGQVQGSFRIVNSAEGTNWDPGKFAGACTVVLMDDLPGFKGMNCTGADHQCSGGDGGDPNQWYSYCDLPKSAPANAVGKCWGKPINRSPDVQPGLDKQYCNRSIDYPNPVNHWTLGETNPASQVPVNLGDPALAGLKSPSRWRVNACVVKADRTQVCDYGKISVINRGNGPGRGT